MIVVSFSMTIITSIKSYCYCYYYYYYYYYYHQVSVRALPLLRRVLRALRARRDAAAPRSNIY